MNTLNRQADLLELEREIFSTLRSQGAHVEEIMAAMIDVEGLQAQLLAYAVSWDATAEAQNDAARGRRYAQA